MESIKELYRIGRGPSSSHTMGPEFACEYFIGKFGDAASFEATLYGSLCKTGRGHMTDQVILGTLGRDKTTIVWDESDVDLGHPNTMILKAFDENKKTIGESTIFSVGGGKILIDGQSRGVVQDVYPHKSFESIKSYCEQKSMRLWEYVKMVEGEDIFLYLEKIWGQMKMSVRNGLESEGELSGGLNIQRKAKLLFNQRHIDESPETREHRLVCSYAFAVSEENAAAGIIVTAPTCGACGVLPAVMYYMQQKKGFSDFEIAKALAVAGIIGNLIKTNASISGAECGCQAEIGSACSMAAAALAELFMMDLNQIEYAAEVAMEHHLGLTCDPINGLVQIPCIERNAVAAMRAINALSFANFLTHTRKISFDVVVKTMYETGLDLFCKYKETSEGGLAKVYHE